MDETVVDTPRRGPLAALGWACFLGSSWTWIIGMVFPILLLRDYGITGWWVFAIPNVIGAAAMGFVLGRPEVGARVFEKHVGMCVRFSEATLAFHFFVITWLFTRLLGGWWPVPVTIVLGLGFWAISVKDRGAVLASVAVTLVSFALFGVLLTTEGAWFGVAGPLASPPAGGLPGGSVWFFAVASLTGFSLCPYLDATFHRARQATAAGTGKAAFAIGFGVVFFAMIIFTLAYAGQLIPWLDDNRQNDALPAMWTWILGAHLILQSGLTIGLHLREANENPLAYRLAPRLAVVGVVGVGLGLLLQEAPLRLADNRTLLDGEVVYRCFLLLYGLVFPAYVFLVMLPPLRGGRVSQPVRIGLFIFATLTSLPFGFAGFVMGFGWSIVLAVLLLVLARVVIEVTAARGEPAVSPLA